MTTIQFALRGGEDDSIQLIQLLKATNCVYSGSEAQEVVAAGMVTRNGVIELRKRAKITSGEVIEFDQYRIEVL
ncbi:MAG: RNA-binding S4 domain-containing protein [Paludibacteraceae bacterium]|nr:RNA-binding S4 domain-containing protein [Paludibacteraceae bacterium]